MDDKESKVKKIVFSVIAACSLFALFGCNHRAETDTVQPAAMEELKPMQQSWRGVLPCADCEGIDTSLFLEKDGTWVMNERYQGVRDEPSSFASYGTWARTADKLVLTDSKGAAHALTAPVVAGAWQVNGPSSLPGGAVAVAASLRGFAPTAVPPAAGSFTVLVPVLTVNAPDSVMQGVAPEFTGTVTHLKTAHAALKAQAPEVLLAFVDSRGNAQSVQAAVVNGNWQATGPATLSVGVTTITVSLPAVPAAAPVAVSLSVQAPKSVPVDAGWALALLGAALAGLGLRRTRNTRNTRNA